MLVLACAMLVTVEPIYAKKKKNTKTTKKESPYEKIFKGKKDEVKKGVITLHKIEGKILFEFPLTLQNREMLLGSTVSEISDNGNALVGQKIKKPLHIKFALRDSVMEMREVSNFARRPIFSTSKDESIKRLSSYLVWVGVKFSNAKEEELLINDASQIGSKKFDFSIE